VTRTWSPRSTSAFHAVAGQHHLQLGVALAQRREAQLAGVAAEDHPAGHADALAGHGVRLEVGIRGPDGGQRAGAVDRDGVRVDAGLAQTVELGAADPHLLRELVDVVRHDRMALTHGGRAYGRRVAG
jgi:hypothetical protein